MSTNSRIRHSLRLSIDSTPINYASLKPFNTTTTPDSGSSASSESLSTGSTNSTTSSSRGPGWRICSVLCLHDYTSTDPTHLSFARNEILEIVQQEETGWWAALRIEDNRVGWISRCVTNFSNMQFCLKGLIFFSAFVEPLSEELAEKLRATPEPLRVLKYDEELYPDTTSAQIAEPSDPMSPLSADSETHSNWLPNIEKVGIKTLLSKTESDLCYRHQPRLIFAIGSLRPRSNFPWKAIPPFHPLFLPYPFLFPRNNSLLMLPLQIQSPNPGPYLPWMGLESVVYVTHHLRQVLVYPVPGPTP